MDDSWTFAHMDATSPNVAKRLAILTMLTFGGLGAALSWVATERYGAAMSPDSVAYVSTARNLAAGRGLVTYRQLPLVQWPPLYPAVLALGAYSLGVDAVVLARMLNGLLMAATIVGVGLLTRRLLPESWAWPLITAAASLLWGPLFGLSVWLLTDIAFVAIALGFLVLLDAYVARGGPTLLAGAALLAVVGFYTRYVGLAFIATGVLVLLLGRRSAPLRSRLAAAAGFGLFTTVLTGAWIARNMVLTGMAFGPRPTAGRAWTENIELTWRTISNWIVPLGSNGRVRLAICAGLIVLLVVAARRDPRSVGTAMRRIQPLAVWLLFFVGLTLWSSSRIGIDPIGDRLLAPVYAPLIILLAVLVDAMRRALLPSRFQSTRWRRVGCLLGLVVAGSLFRGRLLETLAMRAGGAGGYSVVTWKNSETVNCLQRMLDAAPATVFSNRPDFLYLEMSIPARMLPQPGALLRAATGQDAPQALAMSCPDLAGAYAVWFDNWPQRSLVTVQTLSTVLPVALLAACADGRIYRVGNGDRALQTQPTTPDAAGKPSGGVP